MADPAGATDLRSQATKISNGIGALDREHYARGADRIRTLIHQDLVLTRLEDCFTTVERKMIDEGAFLQVRETRTMFPDWMRPHFTEIVEGVHRPQGDGPSSRRSRPTCHGNQLFLLEPAVARIDGKPLRA